MIEVMEHEAPNEAKQDHTREILDVRNELRFLDERIARLSDLNDAEFNILETRMQAIATKMTDLKKARNEWQLKNDEADIFANVEVLYYDLMEDIVKYKEYAYEISKYHRTESIYSQALEKPVIENTNTMHNTLAWEMSEVSMRVDWNASNSVVTPGIMLLSDTYPGKVDYVQNEYLDFVAHNEAYYNFTEAIYRGSLWWSEQTDNPRFSMFPIEKQAEVEALSKQLYEEYCQQNGLDPATAVNFGNGLTEVQEKYGLEGLGNGVKPFWHTTRDGQWDVTHLWERSIGTFATGFADSQYHGHPYPKYLIALHELWHTKRMSKLFSEHEVASDNIIAWLEVWTTLEEIVRTDYIYKTVHGIPLAQEVSYPWYFPTKDPSHNLNFGYVANLFRGLQAKYGEIEHCLMSPEWQAFVNQHYNTSWRR